MTIRHWIRLPWIAVSFVMLVCHNTGTAQERPLAKEQLRSGYEFAGPDVRALQDDEVANPGMLWVWQGETLWQTPAGSHQRTCASCHQDARVSMRGVATRYPAYHSNQQQLFNLEQRINHCRIEQQGAPALAFESETLLALTAYVAYQSRGLPLRVTIQGAARPYFQRGLQLYQRRIGQMNLACSHCHDQRWGQRLLSETISQGHANAYPIYRLEWQTLGSLQRRLRSCNSGVRAQMRAPGHPDYVALELYLAWRAQGLVMESPGVRR